MQNESDDPDTSSVAAEDTTPERAENPDYEIGYGKPPKASQFPKGKSGNPAGSKKKDKINDLRVVIEDVLAESVKVRDSGKSRRISKLEAMLQVQRSKALKGDHKAVNSVFKLAQETGMFTQAKPKGFMVLGDPGNPEEQMILRAFHASQNTNGSNDQAKVAKKPKEK
jgi:hypothetical protein